MIVLGHHIETKAVRHCPDGIFGQIWVLCRYSISDIMPSWSNIENVPFVGVTVRWTTGPGEKALELNSLAQAADKNTFPGKLGACWMFAQASLKFGALVEVTWKSGR